MNFKTITITVAVVALVAGIGYIVIINDEGTSVQSPQNSASSSEETISPQTPDATETTTKQNSNSHTNSDTNSTNQTPVTDTGLCGYTIYKYGAQGFSDRFYSTELTAKTPDGKVVATTVSSPDGAYTLTLPPGSYTIFEKTYRASHTAEVGSNGCTPYDFIIAAP